MTAAKDATVDKMQFGKWLGTKIASTDVKVLKVADSYFNTVALVQAAESIDQSARLASLGGLTWTALEMLMIEILLDVAGFKTALDAHASYQRYLNSEI